MYVLILRKNSKLPSMLVTIPREPPEPPENRGREEAALLPRLAVLRAGTENGPYDGQQIPPVFYDEIVAIGAISGQSAGGATIDRDRCYRRLNDKEIPYVWHHTTYSGYLGIMRGVPPTKATDLNYIAFDSNFTPSNIGEIKTLL